MGGWYPESGLAPYPKSGVWSSPTPTLFGAAAVLSLSMRPSSLPLVKTLEIALGSPRSSTIIFPFHDP